MGTWVNWAKKSSPCPRSLNISIFFNFFKSFQKWRKSSYSHSRTTKTYKFTHLDGKWAHEGIEPKKFPRSAVGENLNFFDFLKSFQKWRNILTPRQLKYTYSLTWMENGHMSELSQKSSPGPRWAKTSIFSIFCEVFENEENPHILTPGKVKYTNSLTWMENGHMSELSQKSSPGLRWAKTSNFFDFFKCFRKWRNSSYSHSRTTKIYKFTHLDGKWAHEWIEPKKFPRPCMGENFNFFDCLKSYRKWRKSSYSHSRTTKIYKFTHLDGEWAHVQLSQKSNPGPLLAKLQFFRFFKKSSTMKKILIFSLQDK